uniref:Uncharacterized protein n=1 Tax=Leersia perrieri TaxID=77586 RepID=A0A0D9X643_9ORYZ
MLASASPPPPPFSPPPAVDPVVSSPSLDHGNATKQQNQGHGQTNQVVTPIPDEGSGAGILLFHGLIVIVRMARMKTMCMLEDTNSLDMP